MRIAGTVTALLVLGALLACKKKTVDGAIAEHREGVEQIQRQGTSVGCQEGQACGG